MIASASPRRIAASRSTMTPPSDDKRPASNLAASDLPATGGQGKAKVLEELHECFRVGLHLGLLHNLAGFVTMHTLRAQDTSIAA